jgi:hypothetical protein
MEVSPGSTLARWKTILDSYNFEIMHLPGKQNAIADALSRRPESIPNTPVKARAVEEPKPSNKLIVQRTFVSSRMSQSIIAANRETDINFSERITNAYAKELKQFVNDLLKHRQFDEDSIRASSIEIRELYDARDSIEIRNGILRYYVGDNFSVFNVPCSIRTLLLEMVHSSAHQSAAKMLEALKLPYWWPSIRRDILQYVSLCVNCNRNRAPNPKRKAEMQLFIAN